MLSKRSGGILVAAMALALVACSDDTTAPATSFTAALSAAKEIATPPVTSSGTGTAACSIVGATISCTVTYSGLTGNPTASHIHLGAASANGAVRVNLCGAGGAPACPAATSGTFTFAQAPTSVVVAGVLQTAAQAFAQVVNGMRTYGAYVNIHTAANPAGEIRGELFGAY